MEQKSVSFLKEKGLIKEENSTFIIKGDFGEFKLEELLEEYLGIYLEEIHDELVDVDSKLRTNRKLIRNILSKTDEILIKHTRPRGI